MARTRQPQASSQRLILDSGAVIALSRNDSRARAALTAAYEVGARVSIPSVVIAETVRGSAKDAPVNRVIHAVGEVISADEEIARAAGGLLGATRSRARIDSVVVATAIGLAPAVVLTCDPDDLGRLAAAHPDVVIQPL